MSFAVAQLTDPHIGADWSDDALAAAVSTVNRVRGGPPAAVVISGDVANTPTDSEYEQARAVLDGLGAPIYAIAGNHDDRDGLRRHFEFPAMHHPPLLTGLPARDAIGIPEDQRSGLAEIVGRTHRSSYSPRATSTGRSSEGSDR